VPDSLVRLITVTDSPPTVLVSLGSPTCSTRSDGEIVLARLGAVRASERAVGLALLGQVPITGLSQSGCRLTRSDMGLWRRRCRETGLPSSERERFIGTRPHN
jgi:hypothetical protein